MLIFHGSNSLSERVRYGCAELSAQIMETGISTRIDRYTRIPQFPLPADNLPFCPEDTTNRLLAKVARWYIRFEGEALWSGGMASHGRAQRPGTPTTVPS